MLSDRWGRKPIITLGLIIFILGSLLAAMADSVDGLILGRALQGAGAVSAAIMALAADLTSEQHRTKVMACIGMSTGAAFSIAFILGPLLYTWIGIKGLFYLGICPAILAIITLLVIVPNPVKQQHVSSINFQNLKTVLFNVYLIKLDISIFTLHLILTTNFVVIPIVLRDIVQISFTSHWQIYLTALFASLFIVVPFIIFGDRLNKAKLFYVLSILLIILSQAGFAFFHLNMSLIIIFLILFFGAFSYLKVFLPSEVSKATPADTKGTALGIYSTSQSMGIFIGGLAGGFFHQQFGLSSVHLFCLFTALFWFALIILLPQNERTYKNGLEEEAV